MELFFLALAILTGSGILAWIFSFWPRLAGYIGVLGAMTGGCIGVWAGIQAILSMTAIEYYAPGHLPLGSFSFKLDALAGCFIVLVMGISVIVSMYSFRYWYKYRKEHNLGGTWLFYNILVASMAVVVSAANGIMFLIAWEIMTLATFFLIVFEHERPETRSSGITYLIASHIGTAFLFVMFWILSSYTYESMEFSDFAQLPLTPTWAGILFVLCMLGFGLKAGIMPLHIWMPEVYPGVHSNMLAIMSGIMIKIGIYGILRFLGFLGVPPVWWGLSLILVGVFSGLVSIMHAAVQHDIKRSLSYHSIENISIITIGIGIGILGMSLAVTSTDEGSIIASSMAVLGFAGAILHVFNHAFFKSLLFLCCGVIQQKTHCREFEPLGGLLKKMPVTGTLFFVGSMSIAGLPPWNGFISEFWLYLSAFQHIANADKQASLATLIGVPVFIIIGLAIMGGLALATFSKAFSIIFLGEPRSQATIEAKDAPKSMLIPMIILAMLCGLVSIVIMWIGPTFLSPILQCILPSSMPIQETLVHACSLVGQIFKISCIFIGIILVLLWVRCWLLSKRDVSETGTWDCGYLAPTARIQYTASSFVAPIADLFSGIIRYHKKLEPIRGYFSPKVAFVSHSKDMVLQAISSIFAGIIWCFRRLEWLQHGRLHLYLLYIALTLVSLLLWFLFTVRY